MLVLGRVTGWDSIFFEVRLLVKGPRGGFLLNFWCWNNEGLLQKGSLVLVNIPYMDPKMGYRNHRKNGGKTLGMGAPFLSTPYTPEIIYLEHLFGVLNEWVPGCPWPPTLGVILAPLHGGAGSGYLLGPNPLCPRASAGRVKQTAPETPRWLDKVRRWPPDQCMCPDAAECMNLRETQHTPKVAYPRHPLSPPNDSGIPNHKLLVGGLGYAPGVCWKVLRIFPHKSLT